MKKTLLLLAVLISSIAFPQGIPAGGSAYDGLRKKASGTNLEWKAVTPNSPLTYTPSTNTFGVDTSILATQYELDTVYAAINNLVSDAITELAPVISRINNPPGSPSSGDRHLINTSPTGAWVGHGNKVAEWNGSAWVYTVPVEDNVVYITSTFATLRYNGTVWITYSGQAVKQNGNSFFAPFTIGSNNDKDVKIKRNAIVQLVFGNASTTFTNPIIIPATYIAGGYSVTVTGTASISGTNTGDQTNISGNAATVTTNANLTGPITSSGNATSIASQTGTGSTIATSVSPAFTGTLTATAIVTPSVTVTGQIIIPTLAYIDNSQKGASTACVYNAIASLGGICGISNGSGIYTYHSTLIAAITASSAGQTIEVFADITENSATTVTLKAGVNIQWNGHTYTMNGAAAAFVLTNSTAYNISFLNGNIIATGGFDGFNFGNSVTGTIDFTGTTFKMTAGAYAMYAASGSFLALNANIVNTSGYGLVCDGGTYTGFTCNTSSIGLWGFSGSIFNNCYSKGGSECFRVNGGVANNCVGDSQTGYGINAAGAFTLNNCSGRSISGDGLIFGGAGTANNTSGSSVSGSGANISAAVTCNNCAFTTSSGWAISIGVADYVFNNCVITSSTNFPVRSTALGIFRNCVITSLYNNAAGYAMWGNNGIASEISKCVITCANTSAPYLYNNAVAATIKISPDTKFIGGAASNANITSTLYGIATLSGGTITVSTVDVTAISRIFLTGNGGTLTNIGVLYEDKANRTAGTSFIIKSSNVLDAANVAWEIHDSHN